MASVTFKAVQNETIREDGTQLVMIRVTFQRKHKYVGTGVYVKAKHFNAEGDYQKENWVRKNFGETDAVSSLNGIVKTWFDKGASVVRYLNVLQRPYTVADVKERMEMAAQDSFPAYWRKVIQEEYRDRGKHGTAYNLDVLLRTLCRFMGVDAETGDFTIYELTSDKIKKFETHLLTMKPKRKATTTASRRNTVNEYLRKVHQYIRAFIIDRKLPDEIDPLRGRIFRDMPTDRQQLSEGEFKVWCEAQLPTDTAKQRSLLNARNMLVASYYLHGLRVGDLLQARVSQLQTEWQMVKGKVEKQWRFYTSADKTEKVKSIIVEEEILPILQAYAEGKQPDDFLFPYLDNTHKNLPLDKFKTKLRSKEVYLNDRLKILAEQLGINKQISMHSARHSFADDLYEETNDIRMVQLALDHASIDTSVRYMSRSKKQGLADKANALYRKQKERAEESAKQGDVQGLEKVG